MYNPSLLLLKQKEKYTFYKQMKIHWNGIFLKESKSRFLYGIWNCKKIN